MRNKLIVCISSIVIVAIVVILGITAFNRNKTGDEYYISGATVIQKNDFEPVDNTANEYTDEEIEEMYKEYYENAEPNIITDNYGQ